MAQDRGAAAPRRCLVTARLAGTEHAALTSEIFINNRLHPLPAKTGKMASMNPADRHLSEPPQTFAELIWDGMIEMVIQCAVIKRIAVNMTPLAASHRAMEPGECPGK